MSTRANNYFESLSFICPQSETTKIALVGCGGTGSWLAPALARLARIGRDKGMNIDLYFVDPDVVEEKNIYRQNFCSEEIGQNKAEALAVRYALAWGIEINSAGKRLAESYISSNGMIYCGCVDGQQGRSEILKMFTGCMIPQVDRSIWIDSGNEKASGQVLVGTGDANRSKPFAIAGCCGWLPLPSQQAPELVTPLQPPPSAKNAAEGDTAHLSCAEIALQGAQGLTINQAMAAVMADYIFRIVLTKDLRKFATEIDLAAGTMTSKYITKAAIQRYLKG
jgi:PRTRC genetic system ThiF family protein